MKSKGCLGKRQSGPRMRKALLMGSCPWGWRRPGRVAGMSTTDHRCMMGTAFHYVTLSDASPLGSPTGCCPQTLGEGSRLNSSAGRSPWAWRTRSTWGIRKGSVFVIWRLKFDFKGDFQWCDVLAWLGRIKRTFQRQKKSAQEFLRMSESRKTKVDVYKHISLPCPQPGAPRKWAANPTSHDAHRSAPSCPSRPTRILLGPLPLLVTPPGSQRPPMSSPSITRRSWEKWGLVLTRISPAPAWIWGFQKQHIGRPVDVEANIRMINKLIPVALGKWFGKMSPKTEAYYCYMSLDTWETRRHPVTWAPSQLCSWVRPQVSPSSRDQPWGLHVAG